MLFVLKLGKNIIELSKRYQVFLSYKDVFHWLFLLIFTTVWVFKISPDFVFLESCVFLKEISDFVFDKTCTFLSEVIFFHFFEEFDNVFIVFTFVAFAHD